MNKERWVVYSRNHNDNRIYRIGTGIQIMAESAAEAVHFWRNVAVNANCSTPLAAEPYYDSISASSLELTEKGFAFNEARVKQLPPWNALCLKDEIASSPGPRKPVPVCPVEVWNDDPVDADKAWQAVIAMCKGE